MACGRLASFGLEPAGGEGGAVSDLLASLRRRRGTRGVRSLAAVAVHPPAATRVDFILLTCEIRLSPIVNVLVSEHLGGIVVN